MLSARLFLTGAVLALASLALPRLALAAPSICGTYRVQDGSDLLLVDTADTLIRQPEGQAPQPFAYHADADGLVVYSLDSGYTDTWTREPGRDRIRTSGGTIYTREQARACKPAPEPAAGSCRADLTDCLAGQDDASEAILSRWCEDEKLGFACVALFQSFQEQAEEQAQAVVEPGDDTPPPECRQGTPTFSEEACLDTIRRLFVEEISAALKDGADTPLPSPQLDRVHVICERNATAKVCQEAARKLWSGARYGQARAALALACADGQGDACADVAPLHALGEDLLAPGAMTSLPCGRYRSASGHIRDLDFRDRGLVDVGWGEGPLRARWEDDAIRIRHNKNGDFVLRPVGGGRLVGMDRWNRFAVYALGDGTRQCAPPHEIEERPLPTDCPVAQMDKAEACCAEGKLQGCNAAGHAHVLVGAWAEARQRYAKVCAAGIRAGCESLVAVSEAEDEAVIGDMQSWCSADPRHVACDVLETGQWGELILARMLQDTLREIEADIETGNGSEPGDAGLDGQLR